MSEMLEVAKRAGLEAGKIALELRDKLKIKLKSNQSDIVTQADLASEKVIFSILKASFPMHNYISEEAGKKDNNSEYTWVIDPIDGTLPYAAGLPFFGISIGLLKNNKPFIGVINLPALKSLYWAENGKGAFLNGKRIKVSSVQDLSKAIVLFDYHYAGRRVADIKKILLKIVDKIRYPPTFASSVVSLAYVASGICHGDIHTAFPWDFVAGAAIIEEAGGKVTDYKGGDIDWSKDSIDLLASNGKIHDEILSLIRL
ncbi:MAG: Myo-inositol-monophosphatase [Candidatus Woesebacteria bacterium GW2011_GWB1_39_12]|uniref:Inositol-1-monophosphatase n=2 Tax=Candidatus Woeseibacteriota TaxID=1752722 RepID=A0A0G0Q977_9BACT|nr:MAG: Myo-inositol-monophosphatase [Candidatus Woesebacteria bacterium GW2011_GWA1_39_12]KKR00311.1 MAG: Myo-inositol-monophosphatase [Candidatus Woesebacteria bacterium GW2011_GWB1_39_12]